MVNRYEIHQIAPCREFITNTVLGATPLDALLARGADPQGLGPLDEGVYLVKRAPARSPDYCPSDFAILRWEPVPAPAFRAVPVEL